MEDVWQDQTGNNASMSAPKQLLDYFFAPRSVALFGVTEAKKNLGQEILRSLMDGGYGGDIYPINPNLRHALALPCFRNLNEVPSDVDLAVFACPATAIMAELDACLRKHVRGIIIVSGGFKEKGSEGARMQDQIIQEARLRGIRVLGPNCLGVYNPSTKVQTLFQSYSRQLRPGIGGIALLSQSAALACSLLDWLAEEGLGMSKFIGYGNRADLDETDFLDYLKEDSQTKVIGLQLESFSNGRKFLQSSSQTSQEKPVIVLKTGRGFKSSESVSSHTGGIAGNYPLQSALFRQSGLIEAHDEEEFFDALKIFSFYEHVGGSRIALVTNGAGLSIAIADLLEDRGLELPAYEAATEQLLKTSLPAYCVVENPLDLTGSATSEDFLLAMQTILSDEQIDIMIVCPVMQDTFLDEGITDVVARMLPMEKPIIACASGGPYTEQRINRMQMDGLPVFPTARRTVEAVAKLVWWSRLKQRKTSDQT